MTKDVTGAMQGIARAISQTLDSAGGQQMGFVLICFDGPAAQYVSNCDRREVAHAIQQMIDSWAAGSQNTKH